MDVELAEEDSKTEMSRSSSGKENASPPKTLFHPFKCRLNGKTTIETSSSTCLTQVGLACWSLGMLTIFRPCFVLLISILERINVATSSAHFKNAALAVCCFWFTLILFVLFVLGFIPMFATAIKKRWVLLIHPWLLMMLYFDVAVMSTVTILLQIELYTASPSGKNTIKQVECTLVFFVVIYVDIIVYFVIYYVYVTYYIVAELTIIEKFY